jgi:branched-subunit amino acid transport protein AzlD
MIDDFYVFSVIVVIAAVTVALRAAPFVAMDALSGNRYLLYLGRRMPIGVMVLLVLYTLKDIEFSVYPYGAPLLISMTIALVLYWRTKNALIGIGVGLACNLLAVNVIV